MTQLTRLIPNDRIIRLQGAIIIAVALLFAGLLGSRFFSLGNFQSIASQLPILGLLALGMGITMLTGGINLSIIGVVSWREFVPAGEMMMNYKDVVRNVMAREKALYEGHAIAAVAATSAAIARRALKLIDVKYEVLPHVIDVVEAMRPDARVIGVEPETSRAMHAALEARARVEVTPRSIADGLNAPHAGTNALAVVSERVDEIALVNPNVFLILTGGEPLLRRDIFDVAAYATEKKFTVVFGTNGVLLREREAKLMRERGVLGASISLDSTDRGRHDRFRRQAGAWDGAVRAFETERGFPGPFGSSPIGAFSHVDRISRGWRDGRHVAVRGLAPLGRARRVQQRGELVPLGLRQLRRLDVERQTALQPQHLLQTAVVGDVGGFGRPGGNGARARRDQQQPAFGGVFGERRTVLEQALKFGVFFGT